MCLARCLGSVWWWKVLIGAGVTGFALVQIFRDLFHPTESGALSEWIGDGLFRLFRRWPSILPSAGPLAVLIVIFSWAALLVLGFTFFYWAAFPENFNLKTVNQPAGFDNFWWCLYYSLEMLTTLGLGDIQPIPNWLRIFSGTHTLIGFSLVTASLTWIVVLFPALSRMRTLARKASAMAEAEQKTNVPVTSPGMHEFIAVLAEDVIRTRVDLVHFPILFYFYSQDRRASLPFALTLLAGMAARGIEPDRDPLVRLSATALGEALDALANNLGERLNLTDCSIENVLPRFSELHRDSH